MNKLSKVALKYNKQKAQQKSVGLFMNLVREKIIFSS
jgi:hypothetical protein